MAKRIELVRLPRQPGVKFDDIDKVDTSHFPGARVIFTFADQHRLEDTFVIASQYPNPAVPGSLQLSISVGGSVDPTKTLIENINNNIASKTTEHPDLNLDDQHLEGVLASVYNDGWDMSFVYVHKHSDKSLADLRALVELINQAVETKRQANPGVRLSDFGIYRYQDILGIVNKNVSKEQEKEVTDIKNYFTDEQEKIIVLDDYETQPLLNVLDIQAVTETRSYNFLQRERAALSPSDGAGVLYGVMHQGELHFLMRERVHQGQSQYQVGVGGKFEHRSDRSRFHRAQDETQEEFFEKLTKLTLGQGMLIRHADGRGHLVHYRGEVGSWSYSTAVSINKACDDLPSKLAQINFLNNLLWPFGDFFITNLQFNPNYSLEEAKRDVNQLLRNCKEHQKDLEQFVPGEIVRLLRHISDYPANDIDHLKSDMAIALRFQYGLNDKPFLALVDKINPVTGHALGDYTEAKSTGMIKASDLLALLKGEQSWATIIYFSHTDQSQITTKPITAKDVFNDSATKSLLCLLYSPEYQAQLYPSFAPTITPSIWQPSDRQSRLARILFDAQVSGQNPFMMVRTHMPEYARVIPIELTWETYNAKQIECISSCLMKFLSIEQMALLDAEAIVELSSVEGVKALDNGLITPEEAATIKPSHVLFSVIKDRISEFESSESRFFKIPRTQ